VAGATNRSLPYWLTHKLTIHQTMPCNSYVFDHSNSLKPICWEKQSNIMLKSHPFLFPSSSSSCSWYCFCIQIKKWESNWWRLLFCWVLQACFVSHYNWQRQIVVQQMKAILSVELTQSLFGKGHSFCLQIKANNQASIHHIVTPQKGIFYVFPS